MNYSNEDFHQNSKQNRREKLKYKKKTREEISEINRIQNKLSKQFKSKKQNIDEEEIWEDWEKYYEK